MRLWQRTPSRGVERRGKERRIKDKENGEMTTSSGLVKECRLDFFWVIEIINYIGRFNVPYL